MKFCPTCDVRLKKDNTTSVLTCPKCKYTEGGPQEEKQTVTQETESDFGNLGLQEHAHGYRQSTCHLEHGDERGGASWPCYYAQYHAAVVQVQNCSCGAAPSK